jgi:hypothetical protein
MSGLKNLVTADDIGLVKEVCFPEKEVRYIANVSGADAGVSSMAWLNEDESVLAVARSSGVIDVYQYSDEDTRWSVKSSVSVDTEAVSMVATGSFSQLVVLTDGSVVTFSVNEAHLEILRTVSLENGPYDVLGFMHGQSRVIACRGEEAPAVIDSVSGKIVWKGKSPGDTPLKLQSVFHTASVVGISERVFAAGDQVGKLRFYDIVSQKKPVFEMPVFNIFTLSNQYTGTGGMGQVRPLKVLTLSADSKWLYIGDTYGTVFAIDITKSFEKDGKLIQSVGKIGFKDHTDFCRKLFPMVAGCKGVMGSVRSIFTTKTTVYVVSAGRYAYCFDIKSKGKRDSYKMFMKQKLTACLPCSKRSLPGGSKLEEDELDMSEISDSEADEMANEVLEGIDTDVVPMFRKKVRKS